MSNEPGRSSTSRIFALLQTCRHSAGPVTLTELARRSGIPVATAYRLSRELIAEGALERNADGTLQIGLGLWELGSAAPRGQDLRRAARPVMLSLADHTHLVVHLAVAGHQRAVCVEKITAPRTVTNVAGAGEELPLHATSVGKVILAYSDDPRVHAVQSGPLRRYTTRTIVAPGRLASELAGVREAQVAYSRSELTVGTASVAAPVFDAEGRFVAALGVLASGTEWMDRLTPEVRRAAAAISRRIHVNA
ncbi:IclR family transcriptional regulator [Streptomyces sp. NPDC090493]|uniref:IclR family transcriptional regulator n=1 Tax=Streptomyces sp. NPDC090493 TaxID=3365964 RepID=UPI0038103065